MNNVEYAELYGNYLFVERWMVSRTSGITPETVYNDEKNVKIIASTEKDFVIDLVLNNPKHLDYTISMEPGPDTKTALPANITCTAINSDVARLTISKPVANQQCPVRVRLFRPDNRREYPHFNLPVINVADINDSGNGVVVARIGAAGYFTLKEAILDAADSTPIDTGTNPIRIVDKAVNWADFNISAGGGYPGAALHYVLDCDITEANPVTATAFPGSPFSGSFDGNGHRVAMAIDTTTPVNNLGLFAGTTDGAVIKNLKLSGSIRNSSGAPGYAGAVAAYCNSGTTIENIESAVNITITAGGNQVSVGGIVGFADLQSDIKNCSVTGDTTMRGGTGNGRKNIGGIVGETNSLVIRCRNSGAVTMSLNLAGETRNIGGIAGVLSGGAGISGCTNNGKISSNGTSGRNNLSIGGIAGYAATASRIQNCVNYGDATTGSALKQIGRANVGGILGYTNIPGVSITNCHSGGTVFIDYDRDGPSAGGILGKAESGTPITIKNCYSTTTVIVTNSKSPQIGGIAGFITADSSVLLNNAALNDSVSFAYSYGNTGYAACVWVGESTANPMSNFASSGMLVNGALITRPSQDIILNPESSYNANQVNGSGKPLREILTVPSWWTTDPAGPKYGISEDAAAAEAAQDTAPWVWHTSGDRGLPMLWFETGGELDAWLNGVNP